MRPCQPRDSPASGASPAINVDPDVVSSDEELSRFITSSFPSVWALEALLVLKEAGQPLSSEQLITRLRASELVIKQALASLIAAGLVSIDENERAGYVAKEPSARMVQAAADLYARRPDAVRRMIVASFARGPSAFADAFRFRKD